MGLSFKRTMLLCKEEKKDGYIRYKRLPWELLDVVVNGVEQTGFFVSPVGISLDDINEKVSALSSNKENWFDIPDVDSGLTIEQIDEIVDIMYFDSEEQFYSLYDGVFGYYKTDDGASGEFGYPWSG